MPAGNGRRHRAASAADEELSRAVLPVDPVHRGLRAITRVQRDCSEQALQQREGRHQ